MNERKICTDCKYYPRIWFHKLFNLKPVYDRYAKCQHTQNAELSGRKRYCDISRDRFFDILSNPCTSEGELFERWDS